MTDTAAPITEPHLTPMFATGSQPALAPNTEPHPSPIFDTGPHPEPLRATVSELAEPAEPASVEWDSDEWEAAGQIDPDAPRSSRLEYERAPLWDAGSPESTPELAKIARGLDAAADLQGLEATERKAQTAFMSEAKRISTQRSKAALMAEFRADEITLFDAVPPGRDALQVVYAYPNEYTVGITSLGYQLVWAFFETQADVAGGWGGVG